jgi:hypothetical protein
MGGWQDEAAMQGFLRGDAHLAAMRSTRRLTSETRFARFEIDGALSDVPWSHAYEAVDREQSTLQDDARRQSDPAGRN